MVNYLGTHCDSVITERSLREMAWVEESDILFTHPLYNNVTLSKLQELVMLREAEHDVVHGVAKSQMRLSD